LFIPVAAKLMQTIPKDIFRTSQRTQFALSRKTNKWRLHREISDVITVKSYWTHR